VTQLSFELPTGSLVKDALVKLQQAAEWQTWLQAQSTTGSEAMDKQGIWGHLVTSGHVLKDGDRLEIYRPLLVDPKLARKQRFKRQGKGRTGLFARRRIGSVAGY
jgi:sulfur carrier protein